MSGLSEISAGHEKCRLLADLSSIMCQCMGDVTQSWTAAQCPQGEALPPFDEHQQKPQKRSVSNDTRTTTPGNLPWFPVNWLAISDHPDMLSQNICQTLTGDSSPVCRNLRKPAGAKEMLSCTVIVICFYSQNEVIGEILQTCRSNDCDNSYFVFYVVLRIVTVK